VIDILRSSAGILATLAPFALVPAFLAMPHHGTSRNAAVARAGAFALAAFAVVIVLTDLFLGALDVAPESFQGAAAVIMLPLAARMLWTGQSLDPGERVTPRPWLMPLATPGLVAPASIGAVTAYAARYGELETAAATILAVAVTAVVLMAAGVLQGRLGGWPLNIIGRLSGAFIVVIAIELAVDGVRSV
jgi:small neutral amino acid transporter SnatA (MarC family)